MNDFLTNNVPFNILIYCIGFIAVIFSYLKYKQGLVVYKNYGYGFVCLLIARTIQLLKAPYEPGSLIDLGGLIAGLVFLLAGLFFIFKKQ